MPCQLCVSHNEDILYQTDLYRIIVVNDKYYPGFIRIIVNPHFKELTDLNDNDAHEIFSVVLKIEKIMRKILNPDKINLASFGNMVPHLHWHIIPRFNNDRHFPNPIWGDINNLSYSPAKDLKLACENLYAILKNS